MGSWLGQMWSVLAKALYVLDSAIDHEGYSALGEARAKGGTVAVTQRVIEDRSRKPIVLHKEQSVLKGVRGRECSAGVFESVCHIHDNQGLILDNEDGTPFECRA